MCQFPIFQCKGTVFIKIWWKVLFVAIYSCTIVFLHLHVPYMKVTIPWTLVPILGVATGMLLVFRTNTAYDRYWEARKLWSSMTTAIRNLTRNIWVGVKEPEGQESKILVEKISALNILAAFSYATRNYLRSEYSYEDADLKYLLRHIPKFYNVDCQCTSKMTKKDHLTSEDTKGVGCSICRICSSTKKSYKFTAYEEETPTNIPMELSYLLGAYIKNSNQRNLIDPSLLAALNTALNALVDCVTGFERILRTPIPLAYSVHLHHATWIYICTLPNQLVEALLWFTPVATCLAAFCLLGVLEIGWEIENPFGKDSNDLPLDDFCRVTHREIQRIMGQKIPSTDVWLMSPANRPLAPDCPLNAPELARLPPDDLRYLMKRDPKRIKKYFENLAFTPDDNATEKQSVKKDTSASPSPSTSHKSGTPSTPKESASVSVADDKEDDKDEEEDDDEEGSEVNSKRVSFVLPDDEEIEVDGGIAPDEEEGSGGAEADEEDQEDEEEEVEEEVDGEVEVTEENKGEVKISNNSTEKTEEIAKSS